MTKGRASLRASLLLAAAFALGCGSNETGPTGGAGATGTGGTGGTGGAATGGGGAAPIIDPSLFDCTAKKKPVRVNPIPVACATDRTCTTKLVSAHRAAGGELGVIAPENSLAAIRAAIAMGVDYIETDPRPTKDGVLVNMHDTSVDRTTDGTGEVADMTLAEIQALHLKSTEFPGDFSCEHVPTIEEVLAEARGRIHVLLDGNKTDSAQLFVDAVHATDTLAWAIFDTDSVQKIDDVLALEPAMFTMIRVGDQAELDLELSHFALHPPAIVEVHAASDPMPLLDAVHASGNRGLRDAFLTDLAAGLADDPSLYSPVFALGVDIAQTDRPDLVLQNLGRWPPAPQP